MQFLYRILVLLATFFRQHLTFGLGLDFGGEFSKAAMLLPGRYFVTVEDSISKRKTPTAVSFCETRRFFEYQALKKFQKKNCSSFRYLKRFFVDSKNEHAQNYAAQAPLFRDSFERSEDDLGMLLSMRAKDLPTLENPPRELEGEEFKVRLEEVYGMLLKNLKMNAERTTEQQFKNVVFAIPDNNVSIEQRKRLATSLLLAGMTPTAFVTENTAAAVYHALNTQFPDPEMDENILIINVGQLGVKVSVVRFQNIREDPSKEDSAVFPRVTNIYSRFFSEFNGNHLDYCFMNYALNSHHKKTHENFLEELDQVNFFKLLETSRKQREVLSVNKSTLVKRDNFFADLPLSAKVVKTEFEEHCQRQFNELKSIFTKAKTDLKTQDIKFQKLEVIGGVVRMPAVKDLIQQEFEMTPASHINGDDGPSFGAAFMAANYSAGVKTKKVQVSEGPNYSVEYSVSMEGKPIIERTALFERGSPYGSKKSLEIPDLKKDIEVDVYVPEQDYHLHVRLNGTTGLEERMDKKNITDWVGVLDFELDLLGVPKLSAGTILINETFTEKYNTTKKVLKPNPEPIPETPLKEQNPQEEATEEKKESLDEATIEESVDALQNTTDVTTNSTNTTTNSTNTTNTTNTTESKTTPKPDYEYVQVEEERQRVRTHRLKLNRDKTENIKYLASNKEEFEKSKKFLADIEKFELDRSNLLQKKNELESFVYTLKEAAKNEDTNVFLKEPEKQEFLSKSEEIDDFMFSPEIDTATLEDIKTRISKTEELMRPYRIRREEFEHRDTIYGLAMERFANYTSDIEKVLKRKSWIPEEFAKETRALLYALRANTTELYNQQKELAQNEDPVFNIQLVKDYDSQMDKKIKDMRRIPKPKNETVAEPPSPLEGMDPSKVDFSKLNMTDEKMKEMMDQLNKLKADFQDVQSDVEPETQVNQEEEAEVEETLIDDA